MSYFPQKLFALVLGLFSLATFWVIPPLGVQAQSSSQPILVIVSDTAPNLFGQYLGEILRAEGINSFDLATIDTVNAGTLTPYQLVILAEIPLSGEEAGVLTNYVNGGGYLIAMRPDDQIKHLFGLDTLVGTQSDGYLKLSGFGPSVGLPTVTLQIHGATSLYTPSSAIVLAELYDATNNPTLFPAVAQSADGHGIAFLYDLAQSIVLTRQGNPTNADVDADNDADYTTIDLFQGVGGEPHWVDLDRMAIPQADEQMRFFGRLVQRAINASSPMPQLWYFPGTAKTMLIITADAHANPLALYQDEITLLNSYGADATFYLSIGSLDNNLVQNWRSQGHEFGIHAYDYRPDTYPPYNITNMNEGYNVLSSWFAVNFTSPMSPTVRNHNVSWLGWTDAADIAVSYGMAMDTNFYMWGSWLKKPDNSWARGYLTGSGQPMKFMKADGTILPYYQQLTQLVDEQLINGAGSGGAYEALSPEAATFVSRQLIDSSLAGDYAALMTQFHVDYIYANQAWIAGTLSYAQSKGVPMWNADRWLSFTQTRHDANFTNMTWDDTNKSLSFDLTAASVPGMTLSTILPLSYDTYPLQSVLVDGIPTGFTIQTIKDVNVAFVTFPSGNHTFTANYPEPVSLPNAAPVHGFFVNSTPTLTWSPISWAVGYQIQVDDDPNFGSPIEAEFETDVLSYITPELANGMYYWRVRAKRDAATWGNWSSTETFVVSAG